MLQAPEMTPEQIEKDKVYRGMGLTDQEFEMIKATKHLDRY